MSLIDENPPQTILYMIDLLNEEIYGLVLRLNAIHMRVKSAPSLLDKVRLQVQWMDTKDTTADELIDIVSNLMYVHEVESNKTHRDIRKIQQELYSMTMDSMKLGFVRESSFSESGQTRWFSNMDVCTRRGSTAEKTRMCARKWKRTDTTDRIVAQARLERNNNLKLTDEFAHPCHSPKLLKQRFSLMQKLGSYVHNKCDLN
jgi:hypothetical protein